MTTPIEATSAIARMTQATGSEATSSVATISQMTAQLPSVESSGAADAFRSVMEAFRSNTQGIEASKAATSGDPVAAAQAELMSAPTEAKSVTLSTRPDAAHPAGGDAGAVMLEKSFNHAIFVSLVSQVVGGVSQAISTLVRQQ